MGQFDFRDKWESSTIKTNSDQDEFGGQSIDENEDNPLVKELDSFNTADSDQSVPEGWEDPPVQDYYINPKNYYNPLVSTSGEPRCVTSTDCPSGYSCQAGVCRRTEVYTDFGSGSSSPGDCEIVSADGNTGFVPPFLCGTGTRTSCSDGGRCGEGYEQVAEDFYNGGWKAIYSIYGGGCCNNYQLGIFYTVFPDGRRKKVKYCGPIEKIGCSEFCTSRAYSFGTADLPEYCQGTDSQGNKRTCDVPCEGCGFFGDCEPQSWPCYCPFADPCPFCYQCDVNEASPGNCSAYNADGSKIEGCKKKVKDDCRCNCSENSFEVEGVGDTYAEAKANAEEICASKCQGEPEDCSKYCSIECHCNADCPSGSCGPDAKCA